LDTDAPYGTKSGIIVIRLLPLLIRAAADWHPMDKSNYMEIGFLCHYLIRRCFLAIFFLAFSITINTTNQICPHLPMVNTFCISLYRGRSAQHAGCE